MIFVASALIFRYLRKKLHLHSPASWARKKNVAGVGMQNELTEKQEKVILHKQQHDLLSSHPFFK